MRDIKAYLQWNDEVKDITMWPNNNTNEEK
jgi:hypothetical protein